MTDGRELAARLEHDFELAKATVEKEERRRSLVARLQSAIGASTNAAESQNSRLQQLASLAQAERARAEAATTLEVARAANIGLNEKLDKARSESEESTKNVSSLAEELQQLKQSVSALSGAVSTVAANLLPDQCDCPVCATSFASAGELRNRVALAAERMAPTINRCENLLMNAQSERDRRVKTLAALQDVQTALGVQEELVLVTTRTRDEISIQLFDTSVFSAPSMLLLQQETETLIAKTARRRRRKEHWLGVLGGTSGALASWSAAIRARNDLEMAFATQWRRVADLTSTLYGIQKQLDSAETAALGGALTSDETLSTIIRAKVSDRSSPP